MKSPKICTSISGLRQFLFLSKGQKFVHERWKKSVLFKVYLYKQLYLYKGVPYKWLLLYYKAAALGIGSHIWCRPCVDITVSCRCRSRLNYFPKVLCCSSMLHEVSIEWIFLCAVMRFDKIVRYHVQQLYMCHL